MMNNNSKNSYVLRCKACNKIIQHDFGDDLCLDCLGSINDPLLDNYIEQEVEEIIKEL